MKNVTEPYTVHCTMYRVPYNANYCTNVFELKIDKQFKIHVGNSNENRVYNLVKLYRVEYMQGL